MQFAGYLLGMHRHTGGGRGGDASQVLKILEIFWVKCWCFRQNWLGENIPKGSQRQACGCLTLPCQMRSNGIRILLFFCFCGVSERTILNGNTDTKSCFEIFLDFLYEKELTAFFNRFLVLVCCCSRSQNMQGFIKNNNFWNDSSFIRHEKSESFFFFNMIRVHLNNTHAFGHCVIFWVRRSLPSQAQRCPYTYAEIWCKSITE